MVIYAYVRDWFPYLIRKDLMSSGEEVNVKDLEAYYSKSPSIKEICIFLHKTNLGGDILTGVILPDLDYLSRKGVSQIKDRIRWEIDSLSRKLPEYKRIKKYIIISDMLPRTLNGELKRFEIEKKYSESSPAFEEKGALKELSPEDTSLLSSPLCRKALDYLTQKLKRPVGLDEHLELDLGLDSLERIGLLFEFQKFSGVQLDESLFFFVSTVREVLDKLRAVSDAPVSKEEILDWQNFLHAHSEDKIKGDIALMQSPLAKIVNLFFHLMLKAVSRSFFFLAVRGAENIPRKGPYIFCPNHSSYLDVPLFAASLDFSAISHTYLLGYSAYVNHPLIRWAKKLFRLIPIEPSDKLADTLGICSFVLKNSKMLLLFPEGTRSIDGEIKEFKRGAGMLIKELNAHVVPVYIRGAHKAWPAYRVLPLPAKIEIIFGKALTPEELTAKKIDGIDIYQNIVHNLKEELVRLRNS